jgi:CelD/BcsL family acetyltransferase involved in cellulose biosynthesis
MIVQSLWADLQRTGLNRAIARVIWVLALIGAGRMTAASSLTAAYLARSAAFGQVASCNR